MSPGIGDAVTIVNNVKRIACERNNKKKIMNIHFLENKKKKIIFVTRLDTYS